MKPMLWKPEYSIHDERIDSQHKKLFDLYNQLCQESAPSEAQDALLHELYRYAVFHFAEEEALMATVRYPQAEFEAHRRSHAAFFKTLERLRVESFSTAMDFFREWLVHHILTEDRQISPFIDSELR